MPTGNPVLDITLTVVSPCTYCPHLYPQPPSPVHTGPSYILLHTPVLDILPTVITYALLSCTYCRLHTLCIHFLHILSYVCNSSTHTACHALCISFLPSLPHRHTIHSSHLHILPADIHFSLEHTVPMSKPPHSSPAYTAPVILFGGKEVAWSNRLLFGCNTVKKTCSWAFNGNGNVT